MDAVLAHFAFPRKVHLILIWMIRTATSHNLTSRLWLGKERMRKRDLITHIGNNYANLGNRIWQRMEHHWLSLHKSKEIERNISINFWTCNNLGGISVSSMASTKKLLQRKHSSVKQYIQKPKEIWTFKAWLISIKHLKTSERHEETHHWLCLIG